MTTPIFDFVTAYADSKPARFHMPGHKGISFLGCEVRDLTEVAGADELYAPTGIILESENNATALFETAHSFYSAEGSSLSIKAMLAAVTENNRSQSNPRPLILAARNAHKAFLYACALLDLRVEWLMPKESDHLCRCSVTAQDVQAALDALSEAPAAVYLTSPDYLGNLTDVEGISSVCHARKIPLLVDNAHGAYLQFLSPSLHPIALGADLCCDSAHKTLPVLTGGAYLHVSKRADSAFLASARKHLALFASTSPSYLILQSLDLCNRYLEEGYAERLADCVRAIDRTKNALADIGFPCEETEPLKIVLRASKFGYTGDALADLLRKNGMEPELADREYLVLMATPETDPSHFDRLIAAFSGIAPKAPLLSNSFHAPVRAEQALTIREAILAPSERVSVERAVGRICAAPAVSCPPAVPIVVSGERITPQAVSLLQAYDQDRVEVVLERG